MSQPQVNGSINGAGRFSRKSNARTILPLENENDFLLYDTLQRVKLYKISLDDGNSYNIYNNSYHLLVALYGSVLGVRL
jgi:hypothetical protein